ncbi:MAG: efflux transporter outer membrane subunit [Opitutaceae bacterium]|jgi:multidrug efflux system outer membrane protein|nr:efflux transporter outer membrane subunit [Opitutaceae bacterium]
MLSYRHAMRFAGLAACLPVGFLVLGGCSVGPNYVRPVMVTPDAYTENGAWKPATPKDDLPKDNWWKIYKDPVLDRLASQCKAASPTLQAALARFEQARALVRVGRSALYPSVDVDASAVRGRSINRRANGSRTGSTFSLPFDLSYELDLWGRIRRANEDARAQAEASAADYQNALLGLQADVVRSYFSLRSMEAEHLLLVRTLESRRQSLQIVKRRFDLGASGDLEVSLADAELATAEDDLLENEQERTALRLSLAVLCGEQPEQFHIEVDASPLPEAPMIPLALPSELIERRPDVAAAERRLAAANARVGVARAAFFPSIALTGAAGYASDELNSLLRWDSRIWSFGPLLNLPVFQGGRLNADLVRAQAAYAESLADYRQSVLVAFRDVETGLSDLRRLSDRRAVLERAVTSSRRAADLVGVRYRTGQVGYLDVTEAERTAITNERLAVTVRGEQLIASVLLIKALGGGW